MERLWVGTRVDWWSGLCRRQTSLSWNLCWLVDPRHPKVSEDAMRAMHQQFTATLEGLARQNVEFQNELAQSRQPAANELAALGQDVRGALLRGTPGGRESVWTRVCWGKPSDFSGAQDA